MFETGFRLNIAGIPLIGKIDRMDRKESGHEIIDYKTGEAKDQKAVDKDRQLIIYALGAREALGLEIEITSLYIIEENRKVESKRTQKDLEKELEFVKEMIEKINTFDFPTKPGYPFPCKFCEYNHICPFAINQ